MNNRIMAMLFALVAAMFISIVPVKAEAATCKHPTKEWQTDAYKHKQVCTSCGDTTVVQANHDDVIYIQKDAANHTVKCRTCGYTADVAHVPVKDGANCRCAKCGVLVEHTLTWSTTGGTHKQICSVCDYETTAADHTWEATNNGNGTHTKTCAICAKTVTEAHADVNTDKDCACDICGAADVNHSPKEVAGKAATCTENGVSGHLKCEFCGKLFSKSIPGKELTEADVTIKALEHKAKLPWEVTEDGKHYHECENTGCKEKLDLAAHVAGTYAHDASNHWAVCSVCGCWMDKVDHEWVYTEIKGSDTHKVKCSVCKIGESTKDCKDENKDCFCDDCNGLMNHNKADMQYLCVTPTCTESGWWEHWLCKTCNTRFDASYAVVEESAKFRPATGHALNNVWEETEDGAEHYQWCANNCGTKLYPNGEAVAEGTEAHSHKEWYKTETAHCEICAVCGLSYGDEKHEYTEVELAAASSTGTQRHKLVCECGASVLKKCSFDENCVCKVCGAEKVHDIAALSTVPGAKDPTCTVAGVKTHYKCNTCKGIFLYEGGKCTKITAADTVIPALGHKWVAKGTDVADGKHVMKCDNSGCNKYTTKPHYTEDGDCYCDVAGCKEIAHSHKHVYVAAVPATCTAEGTEAYYYYQDCGKKFDLNEKEITAPAKIPAKGHDFGEEWIPCEDGIHAKFCANCDEFISEAHTFKNGNVQCATCGGEETLTHVEAKAATCTESGNVEYWTSLVTGKKYADAAGTKLLTNVTVAATGHAMSGSEDLANGLGHQKVCMNDGCTYTLTENHDTANGCFCTDCGGFKTGHENELVEAVPATCAKEGTQAHFKCSCGKLYDLGFNAIEKVGTIAKLKHEMNTTVQKDAKQGKHYIECKNCDYKMYEEHAMEMSDPHKGNYHQWLCSCGELKIETHYDKNGDNKCDVCGHSTSGTSATTTVEQHDNKTVYTGDSSKIQTTKSWWQNWLDTLTPSYSGGSNSTASTEANTPVVNESATQNQTSNQGQTAAAPSTSNNNTTTTTTTNNTTANSTVSAAQTNVIAQFVTWILGLFGF